MLSKLEIEKEYFRWEESWYIERVGLDGLIILADQAPPNLNPEDIKNANVAKLGHDPSEYLFKRNTECGNDTYAFVTHIKGQENTSEQIHIVFDEYLLSQKPKYKSLQAAMFAVDGGRASEPTWKRELSKSKPAGKLRLVHNNPA